jgi:DNA-binding NarL/FixJ family response regulator
MIPSPRDAGGPEHLESVALNPRDLRILDYLAEGQSTAGIAHELSLSGNTVRTKIRRLQRKLDVLDRTAAIRAAQELAVLHGGTPRSSH